MPDAKGRWIPLSPLRLMVADLMHFSQQIPLITLERRFELAPLAAARQACAIRPSWCGLFVRAFALVAARRPELRRSFLSFPWPHLYEHHHSVAAVVVERDWEGEPAPCIAQVAAPDQQPLRDFDMRMRRFQSCPLEEFTAYRRSLRMLRLPRPLRRMLWWAALNVRGRTRARSIGTFAVTSTAAHGAGLLRILGPTSFLLHYGMMDARGSLDVRLTVDHRVIDGAPIARALADMERVLCTEVLAEVRALRQTQAA